MDERIESLLSACEMLLDSVQRGEESNRTKEKRRKIIFSAVSCVLFAAVVALSICCASINSRLSGVEARLERAEEIISDGVIVEETTTTTETVTQSVDGDSAVINNGQFEQYNDQAVNGGDE